ncbi:LPO_1073/Vpar_1526 family protein [Comamonas sp. SY3]|uniref:LPO_1073/Vpar_1526 family protein n=1 Tax=Comamonas sp. SY3 TaxID=3243601 RepID=UPI0035946BCB
MGLICQCCGSVCRLAGIVLLGARQRARAEPAGGKWWSWYPSWARHHDWKNQGGEKVTVLGKSQDQTVGENSTALQAGRDIHYHGLSLADVQTACAFFMENNFPRLQEAARVKAEENVREFALKISEDLQKEAVKVLVEKFTDPDVQATMNDAVKACARKGEAASPEVLSRLLVHRMEDNTPFLDTVLGEAVTVVPKLSKSQLAFLAYVLISRYVSLVFPSFAMLEHMGRSALPIAQPGFGLSLPQKLHLQYAGTVTVNSFRGGDIYENLYEAYGNRLDVKSVDELKNVLKFYCPSFSILMENFAANKLYEVDLTSVGYAIAITLLRPSLPLDFSIWLN